MPTHPMVSQDMMPMHMTMNSGMGPQPHHMMGSGMPHMGMAPNPMHHEHVPQSSMYNNSETAYHHHMQSLGCPPPQHMPQQPPPQQLQQLPVQQPLMPCTSESQIVSNSIPYADSIMPPVHLEQPIQMPPEQQQHQPTPSPISSSPPPPPQLPSPPPPSLPPSLPPPSLSPPSEQHQEQLREEEIQQSSFMTQSPVESELQSRAESPSIEQINQTSPPQSEKVQSPLAQTEEIIDSNSNAQIPTQSPNVENSVPIENDNTSAVSRHSRSLSPAELNEPQSLEQQDCWSGSEHDPPPPTLTAEVSPPASPKTEAETAESSIFNFTEDEEPPPPLHSLTESSPRKSKLPRYYT